MKKIVFIIGNMYRGGAQRVIANLATYYSEQHWKVTIVTLLDSKVGYKLPNSIKIVDISNDSKKAYWRKMIQWIINLRKLFKTEDPDVAVSFVGRINLITIIAGAFLKIRIVVSERNDPAQDNRSAFIVRLCEFMYKFTDMVVFQTKYQRNYFKTIKDKYCVIIGNPVSIPEYSGGHSGLNIIAVGKLMKQKHHDLLIRAYSKLYRDFPKTDLYIYGDGELEKELKQLAEKLDVNDRVHFEGNISNVTNIMCREKYFVMCSHYEGMSNALLEAMRCGMVCITSKWNGVEDIVEDGKNGYLFDVNEIDKLIEILNDILSGRMPIKQISNEARISTQKYSTDNIISCWKEAIEGFPDSLESIEE